MVALAASDITVTVTSEVITGKQRQTQGTMLIAATNTYPDGGIPMPAFGSFGFRRNITSLQVFGVDATTGSVADYMTRYDLTNNKLFLYEEEATAAGGPLLECDTSEVPGARTYNFIATGW